MVCVCVCVYTYIRLYAYKIPCYAKTVYII